MIYPITSEKLVYEPGIIKIKYETTKNSNARHIEIYTDDYHTYNEIKKYLCNTIDKFDNNDSTIIISNKIVVKNKIRI